MARLSIEAFMKDAVKIIAKCEDDLGRTLSLGEQRDLLCDNTTWHYDLICEVTDELKREGESQIVSEHSRLGYDDMLVN